jgi:hypothetical protein
MKKNLLFLFFVLSACFTACDKAEQPSIVLYPSNATYEINGTSYTAKQGTLKDLNGTAQTSFSNIEGYSSLVIFTLQNDQHTFTAVLRKPNSTAFLAVGDELPLSHASQYEDGSITDDGKNSIITFREGTATKAYRSLPVPINDEGKVSYFKVTRNDDQYFEGTFEFVYGEPAVLKKNADGTSTIIKAATPKQIIRNGKISIRKQRI